MYNVHFRGRTDNQDIAAGKVFADGRPCSHERTADFKGEELAQGSVRYMLAMLLPIVTVFMCGCGGPIYSDDVKSPAALITPKSEWVITGDLKNPANMADFNIHTCSVSEYDYQNSVVNIDLQSTCFFNTVIIDHGPLKENGYCRRVVVLVSDNGKDYKKVHSVPGTKRVTLINFITPVTARYVRLQAVVPGNEPWSIAEIYLR